MSSFGIAFAPHLPLWQFATFGGLALLILGFSQYRRAHGAWARLLAFAVIMLALANPLIVKETRQGSVEHRRADHRSLPEHGDRQPQGRFRKSTSQLCVTS